MRKMLETITQRIQDFIVQRDDLVLVVQTPAAESTLMLKILESVEGASSSELFWVFTEGFADPSQYASAVVDCFATKHQAVRLLQKQEDMKEWPEIPPQVRSPHSPPDQRLRELMTFARSLLPSPDGMLVVWGMFPLEIADPASYAGLMSQVVQHAFPFPWCHHIRVILRDDTERPALRTVLGQQPRIAWYEPDTSLQAMERSLEEEAGDEDLPLEQRMQAVLVTAGMDCGNRRFDQAMDKYQLLFKYYANQKNLALTALTLNSIGEVQLAQGKTAEAADSFLAALLPASEGTSPPLPVLTTVVLNLSRLRSSEKNWAEAEGYCTELHRLAVIQRNSPLKVYAIEQLGEAQHEQGKVGAALESWTAGATVAEKLELPEQRRSILQRMRSAYQRQGDLGKCREIDQVLVGMERKLAAAQS